MTVRELFDCFSNYFDKIIYFDETNDIEDTIELSECNEDVKADEYNNFIDEYGFFKVLNWRFDNFNNTISIAIRKKKGFTLFFDDEDLPEGEVIENE